MKILVVRLRLIGDVVFTTPAVRALREHFPDSQITYIVEPAAASVVQDNPHLDEVIVATRVPGLAGLLADVALGRRLRRSGFDIAIDFHGGPRASLLTWLSRAPIRIGYTVAARSWMYTRVVDRPRQLRPRHSVENQWDLLESLAIPAPDTARYPVEMPVLPAAAAAVAQRLAKAGVVESDRLIVIHVSANSAFRRWPPESFRDAIVSVAAAAGDRRIVVTSGPSDSEATTRIIEAARFRLGSNAGRVLQCGEFSIAELRALFDRTSLFIGGDSGPLHVAATSAVPVLGIYGPTLPSRSGPWRPTTTPTESIDVGALECRPCDQRTCAPGDFRCLTGISPDRVAAVAEAMLAGQR